METKTTNLLKLNDILDAFMPNGSIVGKSIIDESTIETRVVFITPKLAQDILDDRNTTNRKISKPNLRFLIKEIESGNWHMNGDSIRFNSEGVLTDGQHRLLAIVKTGQTLPFVVITGLDAEVFKTIDVGRKRTGSDVMSIEGIKNSNQVAAITKFIYAFRVGKYSENRATHRTLSNVELIDYYYTLDEIDKSISFYNQYGRKAQGLLSPSIIGGFHFLMSEIDGEQANEFLSKVCTGVGLEDNSPMTALRNKLIKAKVDKNYKLTNLELLSNIVYAWNKFRKGQTARNIRVPNDYKLILE